MKTSKPLSLGDTNKKVRCINCYKFIANHSTSPPRIKSIKNLFFKKLND